MTTPRYSSSPADSRQWRARFAAVPAAADPAGAQAPQRGRQHHAFGVEAGALAGLVVVLRADDGQIVRGVVQMSGGVGVGEHGRLVAHQLDVRIGEHVDRIDGHIELAGRVVVDRVGIVGADGGADVDRVDQLCMFCHASIIARRHRWGCVSPAVDPIAGPVPCHRVPGSEADRLCRWNDSSCIRLHCMVCWRACRCGHAIECGYRVNHQTFYERGQR